MKEGGMSLVSVLTLIFVVLKVLDIGEVGKWSWWWVFSPIWISFLIGVGFIVFAGLFYLILSLLSK